MQRSEALYTSVFALTFGALTCFMTAYAMLLHLSRYVVEAGGSVASVGQVFAAGMIGSLLCRPWAGRWVDVAGARVVLVLSCLLCALGVLAFPLTTSLPLLGGLRVVVQLGQAAFLGAIAVAAARIAPPGRAAESLAMLGIGGLLGIMVGPSVGDLLLELSGGRFGLLFGADAGLLVAAAALCFALPRPPRRQGPAVVRPGIFAAARQSWPGWILAGGFLLAAGQCVPMLFIERYVAFRGLPTVALFFGVYAPTAAILRVVSRRLARDGSRRRLLVGGLQLYGLGILLLVPDGGGAGLVVSALVMGAGHCFTYPYLVDLTADRMPEEHRGLATSLALASVDLGFLVSFSVVGLSIAAFGFPATLTVLAGVLMIGTAAWSRLLPT